MPYPTSLDSYESIQQKALKKIKEAAKGSDNEILKDISEEEDPKKRAERQANSRAVRMIMDKCLEEYNEGEYNFKTTVDMITDALKKIK